MRKSGTLAAVAVAALIPLAGCQPSGVTTSPDQPAGAASSGAGSGAGSGAPGVQKAAVGSTITLHGQLPEEVVAVTVVKVVSPAQPKDQYNVPDAGEALVAVQFRLRNTGTGSYDDSPANGAKVLDAEGHQFESSVFDTSAGPSLPASTKIATGATATGYVTFKVPKGTKIVAVQYGLDSGLADQTGEWTVA